MTKIRIEDNYKGPPQAQIMRMGKENVWEVLGHLMLSANPECPVALQELVRLANQTFLSAPLVPDA